MARAPKKNDTARRPRRTEAESVASADSGLVVFVTTEETERKISLLVAAGAALALASPANKPYAGPTSKRELYLAAMRESLTQLQATGSFLFQGSPEGPTRTTFRCPRKDLDALEKAGEQYRLSVARIASVAIKDYCDRRISMSEALDLQAHIQKVMDIANKRAEVSLADEIKAHRALRRGR